MCFGTIPNLFFGVSCKQRVYYLLAPKGGAKSIRQAKPPETDRRLCLKRYAASSRPRFRKAEFVVRYRATVIPYPVGISVSCYTQSEITFFQRFF